MNLSLQPLGKRVLLEPVKKEEKTAGGLIIPDTAGDKKPSQGTVIKVGITTKEHKFLVKEGDVVFFKSYSPEEVEIEGKTYLLLNEDEILAVVK
jgi:chaperonin GroES